MHTITLHVTVTDAKGDQYSAQTLGHASDIVIWDHEKGDSVTRVSTWDAAAWVLTLLQSL